MKQLVITLLFVSIWAGAMGQEPGSDRIKALRTGFFTEKLNLTSSEAEKFWPIYNAYDDNVAALKRQQREQIFKKVRGIGIDNLSDADANEMIDAMVESASRELQLRREMIADIRNVLPPKKIIRLIRAEEEFKRKLLEQMKKRRGNRN